jgi:hypothetical protein
VAAVLLSTLRGDVRGPQVIDFLAPHSPYEGTNTFRHEHEDAVSHSYDLYVGARVLPWLDTSSETPHPLRNASATHSRCSMRARTTGRESTPTPPLNRASATASVTSWRASLSPRGESDY